jgi:hypothetical protein
MPGCMISEAEGGMPMMRMMMSQDGIRMMAEHIEGRLAFLKTELKITDAQLPLWNAFAQAMRDNATAMQAMPHTMMGKNKAATLSDKLAAGETMLAARGCAQTESGRRSSLHGARHRPEEDGRRNHAQLLPWRSKPDVAPIGNR